MKKIILGLVVILSSGLVINAAGNSQEPQNNNPLYENVGQDGINTEKKKHEGKKDKKDKKDKKFNKGDQKKMRKRISSDPFEGLELTSEQQNEIQTLKKSLQPERKKLSEEERKSLTEDQLKEMKEAEKSRRENFKKDYLEGLKKILSAEQYVKFLENSYMAEPTPMIGNNPRPIQDPRLNKTRIQKPAQN